MSKRWRDLRTGKVGSDPNLIWRLTPNVFYRGLHVKTVFVWNDNAGFDVDPEQAKVHRPAKTRGSIMIVGVSPADVVKPDLCNAVLLCEIETDTRPQPVAVGASL